MYWKSTGIANVGVQSKTKNILQREGCSVPRTFLGGLFTRSSTSSASVRYLRCCSGDAAVQERYVSGVYM